jgi:hypothetical protein
MLTYSKPVSLDAKYIITWEDAHGEAHDAIRHGESVTEFIASLFTTPGCRFIGAILG